MNKIVFLSFHRLVRDNIKKVYKRFLITLDYGYYEDFI